MEPNIAFVNADDVWALGYTGQGTVLAGNDTGIDESHPALARHCRGCVDPPACTIWDHNYNWWDATGTYPTNPDDGNWHGTHTTGTMVGDDGKTNQIGMAPGAQMIHCKNMYDGGVGDDATITECFQWDLAPWDLAGANPRPDLAPDAINNSWGFVGGSHGEMHDEILALQAAGILVEVSAGNEGPDCDTLCSPGDYSEVLTTGSVNHAYTCPGLLTGFSSRGPSDIDPTPPDYFPDVMAPGENIRSCVPGGGYQGGWSGTSMSGPHVTGLVGLLWSANPALRGQVALTMQIIQDSAVPLTGQGGSNCGGDYTSGPNNDWSHGTIDSLAAVQAALALGGTGHLDGTVTDGSSGLPLPGASVAAERGDGWVWTAYADSTGYYTMTASAGTFTVTASAFGYVSATVGGVTIVTGTTTARDFNLTGLPTYIVSGTVRDAATGAPVSATVQVLYTPLPPVLSDPGSGSYSITAPVGTYTFQVDSWGYHPLTRTVVVDQNQTQDWDLEALPFAPYRGNPVLEAGPPGAWDEDAVAYPNIVRADGLTYMFFGGVDWTEQRHAIGYATSSDGLSFTKAISNPILAGDGSGFDAYAVWVPRVLMEDSTWILYYSGVGYYSPGETGYQVGRATAPEPSGPWTRSETPVLPTGSPGGWDSGSVNPNSVLRTAAGYVMYYQGSQPNYASGIQIGMATSPDGIAWAKYDDPSTPNHPYAESDPVLNVGAPGEWDSTVIAAGNVRPTAGGWEMLYCGTNEDFSPVLIGYAASADGVHWHKSSENPVLEPRDDPVATYRTGFPAIVMSDTTYLVYYDYIYPGDIGLATGRICMPLAEALFSWQPVTPTLADPITFTASAAGSDPVTFTWDLGDDITATGRVVSHTYEATGTYTVTLTATNCETGMATAVHTLTVQPCVPVDGANFSWLPVTPTVDEMVTFTGTVAAGEEPITYTWGFGDGELGSGGNVTHTYTAAGEYTVVMTATNCGGATATAVHTLTVQPPCVPVDGADFSWLPVTPTVDEIVTFTGTVAAGDEPITYTWKLEPGSWMEGQVVTHSYALPGLYTVWLTATNCLTATATASHTLTVACPPVTDTAFTWAPPAPVEDDTITFTATASSTRPLTYTWNLGDGTITGGITVTHFYTPAGDHLLTLTATNDCGAWQATTATVTVLAKCEGVSIITVTAAVSACTATLSATLSGDGPFTYLWDLGPFGTYSETRPQVDFGATGTYSGTLSVWNCGRPEPATFPFTVAVACREGYFVYLPIVLRNYP